MAQDRPTALVTGSASGIGRATAVRLARAGAVGPARWAGHVGRPGGLARWGRRGGADGRARAAADGEAPGSSPSWPGRPDLVR
jgi:NAD(P)-dependent dehydrogenase (short-subunit alcohol dehydrogenase family)